METSYSCTCEKTLPAPAVGRPEPEGAVMSSSRAAEVAARRRRLSQMGAMSKNDDAAATASATVSPAMARCVPRLPVHLDPRKGKGWPLGTEDNGGAA